jgi:hypothetical protein
MLVWRTKPPAEWKWKSMCSNDTSDGSAVKSSVIVMARSVRTVRDGTFHGESIQLVIVRASSAAAPGAVHGASSGTLRASASMRRLATSRPTRAVQLRPRGMRPR